MRQDLQYLVALQFLPGVGSYISKQLISYCGSAENVFKASTRELLRIPGIGEQLVHAIKNHQVLEQAEADLLLCEQKGVRVLSYLDEAYPYRLRQASDCPTVLYVKGNPPLNSRRAIAFVGTRKATDYGLYFTESLISGIAPYEPLIVSGLAYGIDVKAHQSALSAGLPTLGVMANGLATVYPALHQQIALEMLEQGGLVSENPMRTKLDPGMFPARNRIIAGLVDAVVVVEAATKGGALITADIANSYDREVLALPGNAQRHHSEGCNQLIKSHKAHLLTEADDIAALLNWDLDAPKTSPHVPNEENWSDLPETDRAILKLLSENGQELHIDEISWKSRQSVSDVASQLLQLEFKGMVKSVPGKKYRLMV